MAGAVGLTEGAGSGGGRTGFVNGAEVVEFGIGWSFDAAAILAGTEAAGAAGAAPNRIPSGLDALKVKPKAPLKPTSTSICHQTPVTKNPAGRAATMPPWALVETCAAPDDFRCLFALLIAGRA